MRWKQEFIGDIDYDESLNYLFLPRNFLLKLLIRILICRTSSQYRVLFTTIHQPPPRMMRTEYTVWTQVYFKLLTIISYYGPCFAGWRRRYKSKRRTAKNLFIKYQDKPYKRIYDVDCFISIHLMKSFPEFWSLAQLNTVTCIKCSYQYLIVRWTSSGTATLFPVIPMM